MKPVIWVSLILAIITMAGCQPQSYTLRYRAGSWYEYNKLKEAWIPNNGIPEPLPPLAQTTEPAWVMVPDTGNYDVTTHNESLYNYKETKRTHLPIQIHFGFFYGTDDFYFGPSCHRGFHHLPYRGILWPYNRYYWDW